MRIKLDENLPTTLVTDLQALGHDVDTAPDEGLSGHPIQMSGVPRRRQTGC
jgi:hypothetical protein